MLLKCAILLLFCVFIEAEYSYYQIHSCTLPRIEHGRVRMRQRSRLVKFICTARYELVGNRYATCRNGNWDVPPPVCVRPGCPELPAISHGIQITAHHDAWVINLCHQGYKLLGSTSMYCDGTNWNSTVPQCVEDTDKPSLSCDFEDENICGWIQDELHDFDWKRLNTKTPSSFQFTGPSFDHTYGRGKSGYYMYIESTSRLENDTARLLSPVYDASVAYDGCFSFYYHMFGKEIGGLRVYQKPDSIQLHDMLNLTEADRQQYLLFEQWGNMGDTWFQDVPPLKDFSDGFQIIIEGIRGRSFTSDIAIDDVAILHGENCTNARLSASTPPTYRLFSETCLGRCKVSFHEDLQPGECGCAPSCMVDNKCCPDFVELCIFDNAAVTDDDVNSTSSVEQPQTQKLIGETTTTTTTTPPPPTTKTTPKPTTTKKIVTTTKKLITTTKTVPTTKTIKTTTKKPVTTTKKVLTTTKKLLTTTKISTTPAVVTKLTTIVDRIDQRKEDEKMKLQKMEHTLPEKENSSTWKTAVITIVVLAMCVSLLYLGVVYRGARGVSVLQRLRGRIGHDSEVRYLNSNADEDL